MNAPLADDQNLRAAAVSLLQGHASFAAMGERQLTTLVARSRIETVEPGGVVFAQGEPGDFAFLILAGALSVSVATEIGSVKVALLGPGELVGEIAAFAARRRSATITATETASLLRLEQAVIRGLAAEHPEAMMAIVGELGRRLERLNETIATLIQAAAALAEGAFEPAMLRTLKDQADRFAHFADVFETMAAEITAKRQLNQEMETAAAIQRSFLPAAFDPAAVAGRADVFAAMVPAKHVGGDFFDYFAVGDDYLVLAIGDVSGKGTPAAIFMSMARTMLKTIAAEGGTPGATLARMNDLIVHEDREAMFVTIFLVRIDLATGALDYAGAGHDDAYLLRPGQPPQQFDHTGPAIGFFEGAKFATRTETLQPGDMVFLATDGVAEAFAPDGEIFGRERFDALLAGTGTAPGPLALVETVHAAVDRFTAEAPRSDDTTCLAAVFRPSSSDPSR